MNTHKHTQIDLKWNGRRSRKPSSNLLVSPETKRNVEQKCRASHWPTKLFSFYALYMVITDASPSTDDIQLDQSRRVKERKKKNKIYRCTQRTWQSIHENGSFIIAQCPRNCCRFLSMAVHRISDTVGDRVQQINPRLDCKSFFPFLNWKWQCCNRLSCVFFFFKYTTTTKKKIKKEKEKKMGRLCKRNLGWICTPFFFQDSPQSPVTEPVLIVHPNILLY